MRLRRIEPVLRRALRGPCRVPGGICVLVAVSGGADSTALLVALASIAGERDLALHAAHLDHGLRADSAADAAFVATLCERLGVALTSRRIDARAAMRRRGLTGEAGLRALRRAFLSRAAAQCGAAAIATAHTADDQLETVLLRLARGTGLRGLGGMRPRAGRWVKPMLGATRADVEADLTAARVPWRDDASNADPAYARNRVRHAVVPALAAALADGDRAGLARRVAAAAAEARAAHAAIARTVAPVLRQARAGARAKGTAGPQRGRAARALGVIELPAAGVRRLGAAARRELLRAAWHTVAPHGVGLTAAHVAQLERLAAGANGPVALPSGLAAWRDAGAIRIGRPGIQQWVHPGAGPADGVRRSARGARLHGARDPRPAPPGNPPATAAGKDFRKRGI